MDTFLIILCPFDCELNKSILKNDLNPKFSSTKINEMFHLFKTKYADDTLRKCTKYLKIENEIMDSDNCDNIGDIKLYIDLFGKNAIDIIKKLLKLQSLMDTTHFLMNLLIGL